VVWITDPLPWVMVKSRLRYSVIRTAAKPVASSSATPRLAANIRERKDPADSSIHVHK
jgi:hypothetical protein